MSKKSDSASAKATKESKAPKQSKVDHSLAAAALAAETQAAPATNRGGIIRTVIIVAIVGILIVLMALSSTTIKKPLSEQVWDKRATLGSMDAANYYVMYTDLACPYCDVFSRLTLEHQEEFEQYLADHDILFELRMTRMIYDSTGADMSTDAAEAVYCAMNEDKFWDYYHNAIQSLWDDYQSKGYGAYKGAPEITGMPDDYWLQIGYEVGLGDQFTSCVENHETLDLLIARTSEAETTLAKAGAGLPYFSFNNFSTSGFDNNWDWDMVLEYLNAGL